MSQSNKGLLAADSPAAPFQENLLMRRAWTLLNHVEKIIYDKHLVFLKAGVNSFSATTSYYQSDFLVSKVSRDMQQYLEINEETLFCNCSFQVSALNSGLEESECWNRDSVQSTSFKMSFRKLSSKKSRKCLSWDRVMLTNVSLQ